MRRTADSYRRGESKYKTEPRVLVLCEDEKSAKTYFELGARHFRAQANVKFVHCGRTDTLGIVEEAIKQTKHYEVVYCVVDRDNHANFDQALKLASSVHGVRALPSYPCFEFWLLLHFGYTRAGFTSIGAVSAADRVVEVLRSKPGMEHYAKGKAEKLFHDLLDKLDPACKHSAQTRVEAVRDDEDNPSSTLHELIAALRQLGSGPKPL